MSKRDEPLLKGGYLRNVRAQGRVLQEWWRAVQTTGPALVGMRHVGYRHRVNRRPPILGLIKGSPGLPFLIASHGPWLGPPNLPMVASHQSEPLASSMRFHKSYPRWIFQIHKGSNVVAPTSTSCWFTIAPLLSLAKERCKQKEEANQGENGGSL